MTESKSVGLLGTLIERAKAYWDGDKTSLDAKCEAHDILKALAALAALPQQDAEIEKLKYVLSLTEFKAREIVWKLLVKGDLILTDDRQVVAALPSAPSQAQEPE